MVKVTVAVYVPTLYCGSLVRLQETDAEFPAKAEWALVKKVATLVVPLVLAVSGPVQAVPGELTVQL
jgi:hypothetical protein